MMLVIGTMDEYLMLAGRLLQYCHTVQKHHTDNCNYIY